MQRWLTTRLSKEIIVKSERHALREPWRGSRALSGVNFNWKKQPPAGPHVRVHLSRIDLARNLPMTRFETNWQLRGRNCWEKDILVESGPFPSSAFVDHLQNTLACQYFKLMLLVMTSYILLFKERKQATECCLLSFKVKRCHLVSNKCWFKKCRIDGKCTILTS